MKIQMIIRLHDETEMVLTSKDIRMTRGQWKFKVRYY